MTFSKLRCYFTAATSYDGDLHQYYDRILSILKDTHANIVSGAQIITPRLRKRDNALSKIQIYERENKLIEDSDCVVAEVSKPSLGVGSEITQALIKKKPVLALVLEHYGNKLSPILAGNPSELLFIEYYNDKSLPFKLNNFLAHVHAMKHKRGRLIVVDGGNGSGKNTQAQLLVNYLKINKIHTAYFDFPQYYLSFHGQIIAKYLRGEFGSVDEVSPYLASLAYALDRASVKDQMQDFLEKGGYIVANRYATSSMAHQSAKFDSVREREEFLRWIYQLEYKVHRIPKEDLVLYLHVPWKIGMALTKKKGAQPYLKGKVDIEEADIKNRIISEKMYLELAKHNSHWVKIDCVDKGRLLIPTAIHKKIVDVLKQRHFLPK